MPYEYWRWKLAETFGWTLEYIDGLSVGDFHEWLQIMDGKGKARTSWSR